MKCHSLMCFLIFYLYLLLKKFNNLLDMEAGRTVIYEINVWQFAFYIWMLLRLGIEWSKFFNYRLQ